jgi:hypothetical protein
MDNKTRCKQYRKDNLMYFKNYYKEYYLLNRDDILAKSKQYKKENTLYYKNFYKEYYLLNKDHILQKRNIKKGRVFKTKELITFENKCKKYWNKNKKGKVDYIDDDDLILSNYFD